MMHPACFQRCVPHVAHCVAHPACCDTLHVGRCEGRLHATPVVHPARSSKPGSSQDSERARPGDALHSRVATACCPKPCAPPSQALPWPGPTCAIAAASQCAAETLLDPREDESGCGNTFVATLQHARWRRTALAKRDFCRSKTMRLQWLPPRPLMVPALHTLRRAVLQGRPAPSGLAVAWIAWIAWVGRCE